MLGALRSMGNSWALRKRICALAAESIFQMGGNGMGKFTCGPGYRQSFCHPLFLRLGVSRHSRQFPHRRHCPSSAVGTTRF